MKRDRNWIDHFVKSVTQHSSKGNYKTALAVAKKGFVENPDEFICQYQYAKMLGDYADELPSRQKTKLKNESVKLLKPLLRCLKGQALPTRFGICLNYYYQTEDFKGMYNFGRRFLKQDLQRSYYAQGLAGALIAQELHQKNKLASSKTWARKSAAAWDRYHSSKDKYYFAHYSAAKAYALAGDKNKAMRSLKQAALLGKRPISDWEFADVLKLIQLF